MQKLRCDGRADRLVSPPTQTKQLHVALVVGAMPTATPNLSGEAAVTQRRQPEPRSRPSRHESSHADAQRGAFKQLNMMEWARRSSMRKQRHTSSASRFPSGSPGVDGVIKAVRLDGTRLVFASQHHYGCADTAPAACETSIPVVDEPLPVKVSRNQRRSGA